MSAEGRVEYQKLNQRGFGFQLGLRQKQALINTTSDFTTIQQPAGLGDAISINQYLYLPKSELNTKNSTKRQLCCRFVEFLVFNSVH